MKIIILFILLFVVIGEASAQSLLWKSYKNEGLNALRNGDYARAAKLFESALKEAEDSQEPEIIAETYDNLALAYSEIPAKQVEAERYFLKAIEIFKKLEGDESISATYSINNLALLYKEQKKYDKAEEMLRQALKIREKFYGTGDYHVARTFDNIGILYREQGKYAEAEAIHRQAFEIFLEGADQYENKIEFANDVITCVSNLALALEMQKEYNEAIKSYKIAIIFIEEAYGKDEPGLVTVLEKYAFNLRKLKRNAEALKVEARIKRLQKLK